MNIKNMLTAFAVVFLSYGLYAQSGQFDDRLLVKYSKAELTEFAEKDPEQLEFLNFCTENAYYITDLPTEKAQNNDGRIGKIQLDSQENINFHALKVELVQDDYQYFHIEGTSKMLVIKSTDHIKKAMTDE